MNQLLPPLLIEAFVAGARITGICRQGGERRRLVDILNAPDDVLEIEEARVLMDGECEPLRLPLMSLEKRAILAAVPRETHDQERRRSVHTTIVGGRMPTSPKPMQVLIPPLFIEGTAHATPGAGQISRAHRDIFARYFPLTDATLHLPGQEPRDLPVILVSRDAIAGVCMTTTPAAAHVA